MRLDPKYFNIFIIVCAAVTIAVIFYGTMSYHSKQEDILRENINNTEFTDLTFIPVSGSDTLRISGYLGEPVLIDFWATWSGKSQGMHQTIHQIQQNYPELNVIAASVRDDEQMVIEYTEMQDYDFIFVSGTEFYHQLQVPGVPTQIMIDREGNFFDFQVGDNKGELERKVERLMEAHAR
jgi:thiol-disulfide isomerase/thioredoxin